MVSETVPQQLRCAGYWYDAEVGWYWLRVRAYDPALERFLQPAPSRREGTLSYDYAHDDPLDGTDPSGLNSCFDFLGFSIFCSDDSVEQGVGFPPDAIWIYTTLDGRFNAWIRPIEADSIGLHFNFGIQNSRAVTLWTTTTSVSTAWWRKRQVSSIRGKWVTRALLLPRENNYYTSGPLTTLPTLLTPTAPPR